MKRPSHYLIITGLILALFLSACSSAGTAALPTEDHIETVTTSLVENEEEERIIGIITAVIGLLLMASLVGIVTNQLRLPYTVGLVLIGLALSLRGQERIYIPPEIFLGLLVPPLIFEAAFHIKIRDLQRDLMPILTLAIPGVLITTLLVGGVVAWGTGFPLAVALVFGALVAATDPVAVVALFRTLGVPKRLQVLLEGESLFNDGTAIVVFNLMTVIAVSGVFEPLRSMMDFVIVSGGGLAVGFVLGIFISQAISLFHNPMIETTLTTVLAFGAYIVAEQLHVSGVLAVVAAGLVSGNIGPRGMSPSTRILVFNFWEYAAFLANSIVFLLIGFQINLQVLLVNWQVTTWAILAVLVARAVSVYGLSGVGPGVPKRYKHVLYWGGLRGAISLALALSIPTSLGAPRDEIQTMAFGVVLFTLLVQGLTMKPLITKMGLIQRTRAQEEYQRRHARAIMARAAYDRLEYMYKEGLLSNHVWGLLSEPIRLHAEGLASAVTEVLQADPGLEAEEVDSALRDLLQTQRSSLTTMLRDGLISEDTFSQLVMEVDTALTEQRSNLIELLVYRTSRAIHGLMAIVLQEADVENVVAALSRQGLPTTRLSSIGGFLHQKNTTLLVGVPEGQEDAILKTVTKTSRQRVESFRVSADGIDTSPPVTVGSTIFVFDVERYEEL
ncbi:MAG: Na+/H+ antiporter [Chloroflexota bacterium]